MVILLTGSNGQVGFELARTLAPLGTLHARDRATLDLAKSDALRAACREIKPDLIVNAAAYTAVDKAESEPQIAHAINAHAPGVLAEESKRLGAVLVHYSTDYVFDGTKRTPYVEADPTHPINEYGRSKLAGEQAIGAVGCKHLIFRTSWVYGPRGKNFLLTMLALGTAHRRRPARGAHHQPLSRRDDGGGAARHPRAGRVLGRLPYGRKRRDDVVPIRGRDLPALRGPTGLADSTRGPDRLVGVSDAGPSPAFFGALQRETGSRFRDCRAFLGGSPWRVPGANA